MIGVRVGLSNDIVWWSRRPDSPDRVKVTEVGVDHLNDVDVVKQFDACVGGNHHEVSNQCFIRDDEGRINVLPLVNHSVRCKALGVKPIDMSNEKRFDFCRGETSLTAFWNSVGDEIDCLVEGVHRSWGNRIKPMCFASDRASGDRKYRDRR